MVRKKTELIDQNEKRILANIKNKLVHSGKKVIYETGDERILSREELNTKRINELIRRVDKITTDIYAGNSESVLSQLPELKKKLDKLAKRLSANEDDFRILNDTVSSLKEVIYPLVEACRDNDKEQAP